MLQRPFYFVKESKMKEMQGDGPWGCRTMGIELLAHGTSQHLYNLILHKQKRERKHINHRPF